MCVYIGCIYYMCVYIYIYVYIYRPIHVCIYIYGSYICDICRVVYMSLWSSGRRELERREV